MALSELTPLAGALVASIALVYNIYTTKQTNAREELRDQFDADFRDPLHEEFKSLKSALTAAFKPIEDTVSTSGSITSLSLAFKGARSSEINPRARHIDKMIKALTRVYGFKLGPAWNWQETAPGILKKYKGQKYEICAIYDAALEAEFYDVLMNYMSSLSSAIAKGDSQAAISVITLCRDCMFDYEAFVRDYLNEVRSVITTGKLRSSIM